MNLWFKRGAWASKKATKMAAQLQPEDIKSIAVVRHAAVGDMVLTRPFLIELRRFFPNAKITLSLCSNYTRGAPIDLVDRVHTVYGSDQRDVSIKAQIARAKELGEHDLLFDLAATSRSFWLCLLNKAKLKIGFPYRALQRYVYYDITVLRSDMHFEAENMLEMLSVFGHACQHPPCFNMGIKGTVRERPFIVYFPSASTQEKCWPDDRFSGLVANMAERYPNHEHIVLEGIAPWESIDAIMAPLAERKNVTGLRLDGFDETLSLIQGAALLVANDTGIRNMAIACETPTVGIFFATPVFRYWPRYHRHGAVFNLDASVPSVAAVFESCQEVLAL